MIKFIINSNDFNFEKSLQPEFDAMIKKGIVYIIFQDGLSTEPRMKYEGEIIDGIDAIKKKLHDIIKPRPTEKELMDYWEQSNRKEI